MTESNKLKQPSNITEAQLLASNPAHSIWVNAHAGSGKTKILVDRILRILLNKVNHHEILCITFTKAAAAEIKQRIISVLSEWSIISEEELTIKLQNLGFNNITPDLIHTAQSLCNTILDSNKPLRISTIHSFCETILSDYFIEAELQDNEQRTIDANSLEYHEIATKVCNDALVHLCTNNNIDLNLILQQFSGEGLEKFIKSHILGQSIELNILKNNYSNPLDLKAAVFSFFNLPLEYTPEQCIREHLIEHDFSEFQQALNDLAALPHNLLQKSTNISTFNQLQTWFAKPLHMRANYQEWLLLFFTQDGKLRKPDRVLTKDVIKKIPYWPALYAKEQARVNRIQDILSSLYYAIASYECYKLAFFALEKYQEYKFQSNYLDYNDQIYKTLQLLKEEHLKPWVFYDLNRSISHILIDEAQDTSLYQWEIIITIAKEIFSNSDMYKSIFIVGDTKQSIYGFQGADPAVIGSVKAKIKQIVTNTNYSWQEVDMNTSFRSSKKIIDFVNQVTDKLFSGDNLIDYNNLPHECYHLNTEGGWYHHTLVPQDIHEEDNTKHTSTSLTNTHDMLAKAVASQIHDLITQEQYQPKDIMVLVAQRANNKTLAQIIKFLIEYNIPTSGIDKLQLLEHLAIMDLIAIAKFLLQPLNDLNLAILLKTPIFNFSDDELCTICLDNKQRNLWFTLQAKADNSKILTCIDKLKHWQSLASTSLSIHELFEIIIEEEKLYELYINHFGKEIIELFNQFINLIIKFEQSNPHSLLEHFVNYLDRIKPSINKELDNVNEVKCLTIHGSKGLEAKVVFIIDDKDKSDRSAAFLETNVFSIPIIFNLSKIESCPRPNKISTLIDARQKVLAEESKRLIYVAITRAKEKLYVYSGAQKSDEIEKNTLFYRYIKEEN